MRTLSSVWKHYTNVATVGRETYGSLALLTGAQGVFERDASAEI